MDKYVGMALGDLARALYKLLEVVMEHDDLSDEDCSELYDLQYSIKYMIEDEE